MIDLHDRAGLPERLILGDLLHGKNRAARDVMFVEDVHRLELVVLHRPRLDAREDFVEVR